MFASTSARTGPASWPDQSLVAELLEALDEDGNNIEARKLLIDQYLNLGWDDAATDQALEVLRLRPGDREASALLAVYGQTTTASTSDPPAANAAAPPPYTASATPATSTTNHASPLDVQNVQQLKQGYESLRDEAEALLREMVVFQELAPDMDLSDQLADLAALATGQMYSVAKRRVNKDISLPPLPPRPPASSKKFGKRPIKPAGGKRAAKTPGTKTAGKRPVSTAEKPATPGPSSPSPATAPPTGGSPRSARALATALRNDPSNALDNCIADFTNYIRWQRANSTNSSGPDDDDALRKSLRLRVSATTPSLPKPLQHIPPDALMHVEHEVLSRTYQNSETMLGDPIASIPRENFWASEDGHAWCMDELVQAITANKGTLRNPLTKQPFSVADIEAIVRHPLGTPLAAVQVAQAKLKKGVRAETITRLRSMAVILLSDDTENSHPSHAAVDDFLAYVATLPEAEREAIDKLKVPAVDSHTRLPFEDTIGDAVRDAKGNRICFHKAGDLLKQAAEYLGSSR